MSDKRPILAVNHNQQNLHLLTRFLEKEDYKTYPVKSLDEFDRALEVHTLFCIALIDITGFGQHIWTRCMHLQRHNLPFIIISPKQSMTIQQASLDHGAISVLIKPLVIRDLLTIIRSLQGE